MMDMVAFVTAVNKELNSIFGTSKTRKWWAIGGSTSAAIVGRMRSKFPHLIDVAIGDSPILFVKDDFWEFEAF